MTAPVGPRVSKEEFMHALGLDANNAAHDPFYRAMRDEAIAVYNQMNQDNSNLLENLQTNPDIRPPYFWHHIRPDRQQWGIVEIWRRSGPVTRPFFDRGITTGEYGPNWVTGWLLYSVFRSRDIRNNRNRRKNDNGSGNNNNSGQSPSSQSTGAKGGTTGNDIQPRTPGFYDPVRNGSR